VADDKACRRIDRRLLRAIQEKAFFFASWSDQLCGHRAAPVRPDTEAIAMPAPRWTLGLFLTVLLLLPTGSPGAADPVRTPEGPLLSVPTPNLREYELALDEVELDWSRMPNAKQVAPGRRAAAAAGATIVEREELRALAGFPAVADAAGLRAMAEALRGANPGAEAHLVLYQPGRAKSPGTRRLLTRELGLLLEAGIDAQAVVAGLPVAALRPVAGVAGGYVADATDPLAALELAAALGQRPGVKQAYTMLRRLLVRR
jgi:hypothetical protein